MSVARNRLIIVAAFTIVCGAMRAGGIDVPDPLLAALAIWFVVGLVIAWLTGKPRDESSMSGIQMAAGIGDIALITIAYYHTDAARWVGPVLYALVIVAAMATLPPRRALALCGATVAVYVALMVGKANGVIVDPRVLGDPGSEETLRYALGATTIGALALLFLASTQRALLRAVQRSEERYRLLLGSATDMIFTLDRHGNFRSINDATLTRSGFGAEDVLGAHFRQFVLADDLPDVTTHFEAALGGQARSYETRYLRRDGAVRWLSVTNTPIWENGRVIGALVIARDVTDQREAERRVTAQHRIERVLAETSTFDEAAQWLLEEIADSLGFEVAALWRGGGEGDVGRRAQWWRAGNTSDALFAALAAGDDVADSIAQQVVAGGAPYWRDRRERMTTPAGPERLAVEHCTVLAFPVRYGGLTFGAVELFSARGRRIDAELFQLAETLGTQLGEAIERERLQGELARSRTMEAVGRLVSGVAHELNNPLAAVLGFAEQLLEGERAADDREAIHVIHQQARRARAIVRDLLMISKADRRPLERTDLGALLKEVESALRAQTDEMGVELAIHAAGPLPQLVIDPVGIEQVISNLVMNGAQAAGRGGRVTVGVRMRKGACEIVVEDDGQGIPPEHLTRLFEPFFTTKAGEGTGLGLAVSLGIVERHGGTLEATNRPRSKGGGARLVITLPVAEAAPEAAAAEATVQKESRDRPAVTSAPAAASATQNGPAARSWRVLVIDDEEVIRRAMRRWFTRRGWEVQEAENGTVALSILTGADGRVAGSYDVVLCDLKMPGMTGMELHERLRDARPEVLSRMIFATGDVASPEAARFLAGTRCPVLEKPFELDLLEATVERLNRQPLCA